MSSPRWLPTRCVELPRPVYAQPQVLSLRPSRPFSELTPLACRTRLPQAHVGTHRTWRRTRWSMAPGRPLSQACPSPAHHSRNPNPMRWCDTACPLVWQSGSARRPNASNLRCRTRASRPRAMEGRTRRGGAGQPASPGLTWPQRAPVEFPGGAVLPRPPRRESSIAPIPHACLHLPGHGY